VRRGASWAGIGPPPAAPSPAATNCDRLGHRPYACPPRSAGYDAPSQNCKEEHASRFRRMSVIGKTGRDSGHRVSVAIDPKATLGS
jgi:hypothetical protein